MAQNTITINFDPCEPTPGNGYRIYYRPVGGGAYRLHPDRFYVTPAVFTDEEDPIGTSYEGFIQGDCGDGKYGLPIPWEAINDESAPSVSESGGSGSASGPTTICGGTCGLYEATGEAAEGTAFTWVDCQGGAGETTIAFNAVFQFCTCDDDPQYSTSNVTVVRVGDCV
jgi:hypothetical protein